MRNIPLLRIPYSESEIEEIKREIEKVLRSGFLTMAERVREFEELFADFCRTRFALGTNSGTSALEIALRAINVEGGTVVVPSNTYMATPLAAIKAGARVVFTECQRENLQMDPKDLVNKLRDDTRAVVLVHIGGIISPHVKEIRNICDERNVALVEDAAHAHGAVFEGKTAGQFGIAGAFSFYPTKVLTTAEGGMLVTDDDAIYKKGVILREHGKADHSFNVHTEIGDNWRFSEIHAVLGIQQMRKADFILRERRRIAGLYDELCTKIQWIIPLRIPDGCNPAYYKYICFLPKDLDRGALKEKLLKKFGIQLPGEVYSDPCHSQPVFRKYPNLAASRKEEKFPVTEDVCKRHFCLPLYPGLSVEEVEYVVDSLRKVF